MSAPRVFEYVGDMHCPHCGVAQTDAWEVVLDDECGTTECDTCDKEFQWSIYTSVKYSTKPTQGAPRD